MRAYEAGHLLAALDGTIRVYEDRENRMVWMQVRIILPGEVVGAEAAATEGQQITLGQMLDQLVEELEDGGGTTYE